MSTPLRRFSVAATSALSVTALTLGLTSAPAGAQPSGPTTGPDEIVATFDELRASPIFDLIPGASPDLLPNMAPRGPASKMTAATIGASNVTVTETSRSETSATYRFGLPPGEMTREGAVLQAFYETSGLRASAIDYLTDPARNISIDHSAPYSDQLIELDVLALVRDNFTISGATAVSGELEDHLIIPAGLNEFEITVTSELTAAQLNQAIETAMGDNAWYDGAVESIFHSVLNFPSSETWRYGEQVEVISGMPSTAMFPSGSSELVAQMSGTSGNADLIVQRNDGQTFDGDRVLKIDTLAAMGMEGAGTLGMWGGEKFTAFMLNTVPPPIRPRNLNTVVTGATPIGNDFFKPDSGATAVVATTTSDGPGSEDEVRTAFTTWVTDTCDAEMTEAIPGYPVVEEEAPATWQSYLDSIVFAGPEPYEATPPLYTGLEYVDNVIAASAYYDAYFQLVIGTSAGQMFANIFDWDEACGAEWTPGDDEPGDEQVPASISVNVPTGGVAGEPITLSATVTDADDNPISGRVVTFTINEDDSSAGTLVAAARTFAAPVAYSSTTLTATTGADGVATVHYTPKKSGTLHVSASTGGSDPVSSPVSLIPVTPDSDDGDDDDDDDNTGGGNQSGSGSLGSLFGSLGS